MPAIHPDKLQKQRRQELARLTHKHRRKRNPSRRQKFKQDHDGLTMYILDLLSPWQVVDARRMFSGIGLFASGRMFAILIDEVLYLKETIDPQGKPSVADFEKEYFEYDRQGKTVQLRYYKAPERALEEGSYLIELAAESYRSAAAKPARRKTKA